MKYGRMHTYLPLGVLGIGILGALARWGLYAFGQDDKGLLAANHPLHLICWLLVLAVGALVGLGVAGLDGSNRYPENFPPSQIGAASGVLAACGVFFTVIRYLGREMDVLSVIWTVCGLICVPAMIFTGYCRLQGRRPAFFLHGALCVFYGINLLCRYRQWSGEPQIADYDLQLLACVFLLLTAYHHTAFDAGLGRRRMLLFCSMMAGCLSILCCVRGDSPWLYLTNGIWALTNLCVLEPPARHRKPAGDGKEAV